MDELLQANFQCIDEEEQIRLFSDKIPKTVARLVKSWESKESSEHAGPVPLPSHDSVVQIIHQTRRILFPGYFTDATINANSIEYVIGQELTELYTNLSKQIVLAMQHECFRSKKSCTHCRVRGHEISMQFITELPQIEKLLSTDIKAALEGDPAAQSPDEIIFSYPGLLAITIYRIAHALHTLSVPVLPRIMTEHAHSLTGIDIHPGATIGDSFFIDHGTGIVIGETTEIGSRVRLYQGVTLGALSLPRDAGDRFRNQKRHPTIEDEVIIYANTTILGGQTTIGARSVIGGNIWLTESVPVDTKVLLKRPDLNFVGNNISKSSDKGD
nr:serine acetyltransferase [Desulfobulbaceae bacterium]